MAIIKPLVNFKSMPKNLSPAIVDIKSCKTNTGHEFEIGKIKSFNPNCKGKIVYIYPVYDQIALNTLKHLINEGW